MADQKGPSLGEGFMGWVKKPHPLLFPVAFAALILMGAQMLGRHWQTCYPRCQRYPEYAALFNPHASDEELKKALDRVPGCQLNWGESDSSATGAGLGKSLTRSEIGGGSYNDPDYVVVPVTNNIPGLISGSSRWWAAAESPQYWTAVELKPGDCKRVVLGYGYDRSQPASNDCDVWVYRPGSDKPLLHIRPGMGNVKIDLPSEFELRGCGTIWLQVVPFKPPEQQWQ